MEAQRAAMWSSSQRSAAIVARELRARQDGKVAKPNVPATASRNLCRSAAVPKSLMNLVRWKPTLYLTEAEAAAEPRPCLGLFHDHISFVAPLVGIMNQNWILADVFLPRVFLKLSILANRG